MQVFWIDTERAYQGGRLQPQSPKSLLRVPFLALTGGEDLILLNGQLVAQQSYSPILGALKCQGPVPTSRKRRGPRHTPWMGWVWRAQLAFVSLLKVSIILGPPWFLPSGTSHILYHMTPSPPGHSELVRRKYLTQRQPILWVAPS